VKGEGHPQIGEVLRAIRVAESWPRDHSAQTEQASEGAVAETDSGTAPPKPVIIHGVPTASSAPASSHGAPIPTRLFAGPDQFPPDDFRGYGFFAFPATASEFDFERHLIFCQA